MKSRALQTLRGRNLSSARCVAREVRCTLGRATHLTALMLGQDVVLARRSSPWREVHLGSLL
jgi:hypothetical protein